MKRRDFLIGSALGLAAPLLGAGRALSAAQSVLAGGAELPVAVAYTPITPTQGGVLSARASGAPIRPEQLPSGDWAFLSHGARVTCHGLVTGHGLPMGTGLAADPDAIAVRREGIRAISIELEYPVFARARSPRQQFWSYEDRGVPNVGRSCMATLPIDGDRGLAFHLTIQRQGRPEATGVLRLSPGRGFRAPKLRRGHYLLSLSSRTGVLVEIDRPGGAADGAAGGAAGDARGSARA